MVPAFAALLQLATSTAAQPLLPPQPQQQQQQQQCPLALHHGIRVSGNDIEPERNASSFDACCKLCAQEEGCKVFFWREPTVCWLKTAASAPVPCAGCVVGAASIPPPSPPHPHPPPAPAPPPPAPGCKTAADCNGGGRCSQGACACDQGWTGEHCEQIKFGNAYACGAGGLCLNHTHAVAAVGGDSYSDYFTSSWGGEAVEGDDGQYHMFAASFGKDKGEFPPMPVQLIAVLHLQELYFPKLSVLGFTYTRLTRLLCCSWMQR